MRCNLDVDKLTSVTGKYDARDVYDALLNSTRFGTRENITTALDNGGNLVPPNEEESRQIIAALIAWQNDNGHYNPLKQGKMPPIVLYKGSPEKLQAFEKDGLTYLNQDWIKTPQAKTIFHEIDHAMMAREYGNAYAGAQAIIVCCSSGSTMRWTRWAMVIATRVWTC